MALVEINQPHLPLPRSRHFPLVVGIALDEADRRRLAAALDGTGVVLFAPDVVTAYSVLDRHATRTQPPPAAGQPDRPLVRAGELEVDLARCRARWRDVPLALTRRERALLACLAAEAGRVWTYRQLYAAAWDGGYLDPGPVHAAVKRLRRKLREAGAAVRIDAVRGVGYELAGADQPGHPA